MYGARETDAARGEAPAFSRGTSGLSRGLRLAAVTSSLALVALACVALGRGGVAARLGQAGVPRVACLGRDTYRLEDRYFSYRRATHRGEADYGRQISLIGLPAR